MLLELGKGTLPGRFVKRGASVEGEKGIRKKVQLGLSCLTWPEPGCSKNFNPAFLRTHVIHPGNISRDSGEDCGLPGNITAHTGHKAGHPMDRILAVHQAMEGSPRITLPGKNNRIKKCSLLPSHLCT